MKNKGTGIQWHRIFGIAALMSVIVFAVMLYMDFGTSIKSMVGIGSDKTNDSISEEPSDNTESGNDTSGKKTDISDKAIVCIDASHGGSDRKSVV